MQAETGMATTNGSSADAPLKVGFVVVDYMTGLQAAANILTHLYAIKCGYIIPPEHHQVILIETSMARVSATLQCGQYLNYKTKNIEVFRKGNRDLFLAPFSFYDTKDEKKLSIGIVDNEQFIRFCTHVLKKVELIEKYSTNQSRLNNEVFEKELSDVFITQNCQYWLDLCTMHQITCSKVNTIAEAVKQYGEKFFFSRTTNGISIMATPSTSSLFQTTLQGAPSLGEHNHLGSLLSNDEPKKISILSKL